MEFADILANIRSLLIPILLFVVLFIFVTIQGRRALTSLILGLYLALLLSFVFPYYDLLFGLGGGEFFSDTVVRIITFALFTAAGTLIFDRLLFYRIDETMFQGLGKKGALAFIGTVIILAFSYHVLPLPPLVDSSTIVHALFAPQELFFWWLILPLLVLFLL